MSRLARVRRGPHARARHLWSFAVTRVYAVLERPVAHSRPPVIVRVAR